MSQRDSFECVFFVLSVADGEDVEAPSNEALHTIGFRISSGTPDDVPAL